MTCPWCKREGGEQWKKQGWESQSNRCYLVLKNEVYNPFLKKLFSCFVSLSLISSFLSLSPPTTTTNITFLIRNLVCFFLKSIDCVGMIVHLLGQKYHIWLRHSPISSLVLSVTDPVWSTVQTLLRFPWSWRLPRNMFLLLDSVWFCGLAIATRSPFSVNLALQYFHYIGC